MSRVSEYDTDQLLDRADSGDSSAVRQLFERFRPKLKTMVSRRMDPLLSARVDPSDVVQDCLAEAHVKFSDYLERKPVKFYPWLRRIAWERMVELHRLHVTAQRRSVRREVELDCGLSHESAEMLARQLASSGTGPLQKLVRRELRDRVRLAIEQLSPSLREALLIRYLEQFPANEAAEVLGISTTAFKQRLLRALRHLRKTLVVDMEDAS